MAKFGPAKPILPKGKILSSPIAPMASPSKAAVNTVASQGALYLQMVQHYIQQGVPYTQAVQMAGGGSSGGGGRGGGGGGGGGGGAAALAKQQQEAIANWQQAMYNMQQGQISRDRALAGYDTQQNQDQTTNAASLRGALGSATARGAIPSAGLVNQQSDLKNTLANQLAQIQRQRDAANQQQAQLELAAWNSGLAKGALGV